MEPKFPTVSVQLTGRDGNAFAIIGRVKHALELAGFRDGATEFVAESLRQPSYDDVLRLCMKTVNVQ